MNGTGQTFQCLADESCGLVRGVSSIKERLVELLYVVSIDHNGIASVRVR